MAFDRKSSFSGSVDLVAGKCFSLAFAVVIFYTQLIVAAVTHRTHTQRDVKTLFFFCFVHPQIEFVVVSLRQAFIDDPSPSYFFDGKQSRSYDHLPLLY